MEAPSRTHRQPFSEDCCACPWDLCEPWSSELIAGSPPTSEMKKLRPGGSKSVTEGVLEPSLEESLEGGLSGTFPRGLLGVLRIRALVRDVNLLASSVGSSCQLLLESSSPSWLGVGFRDTNTGRAPAINVMGS